MQITVFSKVITCQRGQTVAQCFAQVNDERAKTALAALCGGEVLPLDRPILTDSTLTPITFDREEGRRIYERSLRLLLVTAAQALFPKDHVRVSNSIGYGVFLKMQQTTLDKGQVKALEKKMHEMVDKKLPILTEKWPKDKVEAYYTQNGLEAARDVLPSREMITMHAIDGVWRHYYGVMLPDVSRLSHFALMPHQKGLVMQMPSPAAPDKPAPYVSRPKHLAVFAQSQYWCEVLAATNAADINRMLKTDAFRQFIRINEALHDRSIAQIADAIVAKKARCILVAGPSSSGKTTFSNRLAIHLKVLGHNPIVVSMDDFYFNLADHPVQADGTVDLEHIDRLDLPLMDECITQLLQTGEAALPQYDFQTGERAKQRHTVHLKATDPLIVEGIHALNPRVSQHMADSLVFKVFVSALACVNTDDENRVRTTDLRLLRRIVRDHTFRNTPPIKTMEGWQSVRAGEEKWIFPYQEQADAMFNTSLHYELPVMKRFAYESLHAIDVQQSSFLYAKRLMRILDTFDAMDMTMMDEIPPLSLIREFIGGCTLYATP